MGLTGFQDTSSSFAGDACQQVLHHVLQQRMLSTAVHHVALAGALPTDAYQGHQRSPAVASPAMCISKFSTAEVLNATLACSTTC